MKILLIGDLHGRKPTIYYDDFDAIIAPGDFCSDGARELMFKALRLNSENANKIHWFDLIDRDKAKSMVIDSIQSGRETIEFLNSFNVPVYVVPGNWDWTPSINSEWDFLRKDHYSTLIHGLENINDLYLKSIETESFCFVGHGIIPGPEYPQQKVEIKNYSKEQLDQLKLRYDDLMARLRNHFQATRKPIIFLSHNVPFNTPLDVITDKNSSRHGLHFGSLVARDIIDEFEPILCIGGHMHEHFGMCRLKSTVVLNAGFGSDVNTLLEIENGSIKRIQFHGGNPSIYP